MKLSIVVVFYNEFDLLIDCINDLQKNTPSDTEIIVVDNNSDKIKAKRVFKKLHNIKYIHNEKNLGFAKAANIGFRKAKGNYLLFSTPDLRIREGTIAKAVDYMKKNTNVGVVGCKVLSPGGKFHPSAFKKFLNFKTHMFEYNYIYYKFKTWNDQDFHPDLYSRKEHEKELRPVYMIGAFLLMREKAIKDVNYFDERYFLYREEADLCLDIYESGWEIVYLPINGVTHVSNSFRQAITQTNHHYQKSTYLLFKKHNGIFFTLILWIFTVLSVGISIIFLLGILIYKNIVRQNTQARKLIKFYLDILSWQLRNGLRVIIS